MEKFKRKVLNKFLQIIRQAYVSVVLPDTSEYPQAQVTSNRKATKVTRLSVYGVFGVPPKDSHVLMFQSQGQESSKFGLFNDFLRRKKGTEGECGLHNTLTDAIVYMKADGSIAIESDVSVDAKAPIINAEADTEINATAPTINVIASTEVNVTAPTANITADDVVISAVNATITATVKAIINSTAVELGDGGAPALEKLMNEVAMNLINGHTHQVSGVLIGGNTVTSAAPTQQMTADTHTTKDTKAS